jgi:hypothetical protein
MSTFNELIDFTRSTTGTYLGSDGLLKSAAINEPRLEYDASGNPLGLLIEEARTNRVPYSDLSSGWSWLGTTYIVGAATAPDGTQTATLMREDTGFSSHFTFAAIVSASTSTTASIFAKAGGRRYLQLTDSTNQTSWAMFDLEQGVVTEQKSSGITATIEPYGNGWYRCNAALTLPASGSTTNFVWGSSILATTIGIRNVYQGNGTSGIYLWGAQVETGAFPTSYIPTSGSTATRNKDVVSVPVERFAYSDRAATYLITTVNPVDVTAQQQFLLGTQSANARIAYSNSGAAFLYSYSGNNNPTTEYFNNGTYEGTGLYGAIKVNETQKFALKLKATASGGLLLSEPTELWLGRSPGNSSFWNGHIKQIQYYPKGLSNEELQLLTQPSASPTMNLTFDGQATSTLVEGLHD